MAPRGSSATGEGALAADAAVRAAAADPGTPADTLRRLARNRNRSVRRAVAGNPNTPVQLFDSLARTFPDAVASNPVLSWLLVENPNWLEDIDEIARQRILADPATGPGLLWWAHTFGTIDDRRAVTQNGAAPADLVRSLADDEDEPGVARDARAHPTLRDDGAVTPGRAAVAAAEAGAVAGAGAGAGADAVDVDLGRFLPGTQLDGRTGETVDLLTIGIVPEWLLGAISTDDVEVRRAMAAHNGTPETVLRRLVLDDDEQTRTRALEHPRAPQGTVAALTRAADGDPTLTSVELEALLATPVGRLRAAAHPNLTSAQREECVSHVDWRTRQAAAAGQSLTFDQFIRLAADTDRDVRSTTGANPALPWVLWQALHDDPDDMVRDATAANQPQQRPSDLPLDVALRHIAALDPRLGASHPQLPPDQLFALAGHEDWRVRQACARNTSTPVAALRVLSTDKDSDVRRAAVRHAHLPTDVLAAMVTDEHVEVRRAVAERGAAPGPLALLCADESNDVRLALAANPHCAPATVIQLCDDESAGVRTVVAQRPHLTVEMLGLLSRDAHTEVKTALLARPDLCVDHLAAVFGSEDGAVHAKVFDRLRNADQTVSAAEASALLEAAPWASGVVATFDVLPAGAFGPLAAHSDWRVRVGAASHPDAPLDVLELLMADSDYDVRAAVAGHRLLSPVHLRRMAADIALQVRRVVARRPDTPGDAIDVLVLDDDDEVRELVRVHPHLSAHSSELSLAMAAGSAVDPDTLTQLCSGPQLARQLVARHPATPASLLERLASDTSWHVRDDVARNPRATPGILAVLAADADRDVRRTVAAHPHSGGAILDLLVADTDDGVRHTAMANPALAPATRRRIAQGLLRAAIRSQALVSRVVALSAADVHSLELRRRRHWQSLDWCERYAIACHPRTPIDILERLAQDGHMAVRQAAGARLDNDGRDDTA